ncbi:hypothetical protein HPP92_015303 [Vanilla planifolia]|uniref:Uncharacterized protein n=1 Tax=Vanilla planifolia TaxID=51239 RepID=A0A835QXI2_VANPL|nr:hypothetical protein HPP92_015303 [Vanilla planifolia]
MSLVFSPAGQFAMVDRKGTDGYPFMGKGEDEEEGDGFSWNSSIGEASSEDKESGDEAESKLKEHGVLGSLISLEDSLPIKRGLSSFFSGKARSFASLAEVGGGNAVDLVKPENPFNKRRRLLMACKASWKRRASYSSLIMEEEEEPGEIQTQTAV